MIEIYLLSGLAIICFWIFTGYLIFVKALARGRDFPQPEESGEEFSVVCVIHNGADHLSKKLEELCSIQHSSLKQIWIILDGCDDRLMGIGVGNGVTFLRWREIKYIADIVPG